MLIYVHLSGCSMYNTYKKVVMLPDPSLLGKHLDQHVAPLS